MNSTKRATVKDLLERSADGTMAAQFPPSTLRPLVAELATLLKEKKQTVAVAETAAGGIISSSLLSVPGASSYFAGGLTLYTLQSRLAFADWTEAHIKSYNGPTPAIVSGLAHAARAKLGASYAVAESGTAGPTGSGDAPNRQPGYVALAVEGPDGRVHTREVNTGHAAREGNMVAFANAALTLLRDVVKGEVEGAGADGGNL